MSSTTQENELLAIIKSLPPDKINEVKDFALFLKSKYQPNIDYSTEWTEEDLRDFSNASLNYF